MRKRNWFREATNNLEPLLQKKKFYMANVSPQTVQLTWQSFGELMEKPAKQLEEQRTIGFKLRLTRHKEFASVAILCGSVLGISNVDVEA